MVPIDKVCGSLCLYICGLAVALARITTNGVDDRQKTMTHCRWQRRPSGDHALKVRWSACGHVCVICRVSRGF